MQEKHKKKLNVRIYNRDTEFMPDSPRYCLEISNYPPDGMGVWFHGKLVAEVGEDGYLTIYPFEKFKNELGIFYYDFIFKVG